MSTAKSVATGPSLRGRFDRRSVPVKFTERSRTKQEPAAGCDVNVIMEKYRHTGVLPTFNQAEPKFGDFSQVGDYQSCLNRVMDAQELFDGLPAKIRAHFDNEPAALIAAVGDPSRVEELVSLGLLEARQGEKSAPDVPEAGKAGRKPSDDATSNPEGLPASSGVS